MIEKQSKLNKGNVQQFNYLHKILKKTERINLNRNTNKYYNWVVEETNKKKINISNL